MNTENLNQPGEMATDTSNATFSINKIKNEVNGHAYGIQVTCGSQTLNIPHLATQDPNPVLGWNPSDYNQVILNVYALTADNTQGTYLNSMWLWLDIEDEMVWHLKGQVSDPVSNGYHATFNFPLDPKLPKLEITLQASSSGGGLVIIGTLDGFGDLEPMPLHRGDGQPSMAPVTHFGSSVHCPSEPLEIKIEMLDDVLIPCYNNVVLPTPFELPQENDSPLRLMAGKLGGILEAIYVWQELGADDFYYLKWESESFGTSQYQLSFRIDPRWDQLAFGFDLEKDENGIEGVVITDISGEYPPIG